ncbi:MAG: hypothetical protein U0840_29295 [Gemmataceae bacterium]
MSNPFVFKVGAAGVPAGNYKALFDGIEAQQANTEKGYGPGIRFRFKLLEGTQAGAIASRVTGTSPTPTNACGKMLAALLGRPLAPGENIDLQSYVGKTYLIIVEPSQGGGTRVASAIPV